MKRKLFTLAVIVICLSILAGGTFANFTTENTVHNVITSGKVDVELLETTDKTDPETGEPLPFKDVTGVMPGREVSKIVQVENVGTEPAYVRVLVEKNIEMADGITEQPDLSLVKIDYDTTKWTYADGYYYYNYELTPKDTTEPLFKSVKFAPGMGNEYQNSTAFVNVYVMAVQTKNNTPEGGDVRNVEGWPSPKTLNNED